MNISPLPAPRNLPARRVGLQFSRDRDEFGYWKSFLTGGVALFLGISASNVFPPALQICFYIVGIAAALSNWRKIAGIETLLICAAVLTVLLSRVISSVEIDGSLRALRPLFEGYLLSYILYFWCSVRSFRAVVLSIGGFIAIQFLFGFMMAANQALRTSLLESIYSDESYQSSSFLIALLFRGYGYSRHHLYGFALATGVSSAITLIQASRERQWRTRLTLVTLSIFGIILTAANARIGLTPILLVYIIGLTIFYNSFYAKHVTLMMILVIAPLLSIGAWYLGDNFDAVISWLGEGLGQLGGDSSNDSGTFSDLASMIYLPNDFSELLFGQGRTCSINENCYSDIGIIRAAQEGGIIYLLLVFAVYFRLSLHSLALVSSRSEAFLESRQTRLFLGAILQITFLAAMMKGEAFSANDYSRLVATLGFMGMLLRTPLKSVVRRKTA